MFEFLGFVGFIGFLVFVVLGIISVFKKKGKAKRRFGIAAGLFVLFLIGAINSAPSDNESAKSKSNQTKTAEVKKDPVKKQKTEVKKEASTIAEVQAAITKGMSDKDYKKAKEKLQCQQSKSISVGNGNIGYVLQAKDGIFVASTDGENIFDVASFKTMDEVNKYEKDMLAKVEVAKKAEAQKAFETSKIKVNGRGDTASNGIKLKSGFAIFDGTHTGSSNFAVKLQDDNGNDLDLLVNTIGNYKGKTFAEIPVDGTYYLNINADGNWNFAIYQKPPVDIPDAPTTLQGTGDDVVFFNSSSGNYKFSFTHQGQSNFAVKLNGSGLMVNEIGNYNGSMRQKLSTDGIYLLQITADGKWIAKIEK